MISVYRADQLKRFGPFSYLNHSFLLTQNVEVRIRFIAFLQISRCFFIYQELWLDVLFFLCQELYWMRDFCISFTSSCFLFPVEGTVESLRTGGDKKF